MIASHSFTLMHALALDHRRQALAFVLVNKMRTAGKLLTCSSHYWVRCPEARNWACVCLQEDRTQRTVRVAVFILARSKRCDCPHPRRRCGASPLASEHNGVFCIVVASELNRCDRSIDLTVSETERTRLTWRVDTPVHACQRLMPPRYVGASEHRTVQLLSFHRSDPSSLTTRSQLKQILLSLSLIIGNQSGSNVCHRKTTTSKITGMSVLSASSCQVWKKRVRFLVG